MSVQFATLPSFDAMILELRNYTIRRSLYEDAVFHVGSKADLTEASAQNQKMKKGKRSCLYCFCAVADWMGSNKLQLNATKTEILWCTSSRRQHQLPTNQLTVGNGQISPVATSVLLSMLIYQCKHTSLEQLPAASQYCVLHEPLDSRSHSRSWSLWCCCHVSTMLVCLQQQLIDKLQSVQNAAARLVLAVRRRDHISLLLRRVLAIC